MVGGSVTPNAWTHLAMTFDANTDTKSIWIDGALAATENGSESILSKRDS